MKTTYTVNWRTRDDAAAATGTLEITEGAVVFTPADGGAAVEIPFSEVPAVRRLSSAVEIERRRGGPVWVESAAAGALATRLGAVVELAETVRTVRAEHDRIDEELGELRIAVACLADLTDVCEREVALLATDLMRRVVRHAQVEERELYPALKQLLGGDSLVDAMVFDHRAIEGEARDLVRVDPGDSARLACVFHRLDALVTTHIAKEEAIVFPLLESRAGSVHDAHAGRCRTGRHAAATSSAAVSSTPPTASCQLPQKRSW